MRDSARRRALLVSLAVLGGCDATAPWSSAGGEAVPRQLSFSPASLTFDDEVGLGASRTQSFAVTGLSRGTYLDPEFASPIVSVERGYGLDDFTVTVAPPESTGPGVFHGVIRFRACNGGTCTPIEESVPVRYVVHAASLTVAPSELGFEQLVGGPPPDAQQLQLEGSGDGAWSAVAQQGGRYPAWLEVSPSGGTTIPAVVTASVVGTPTAPGTVTGALVLTRGAKQISVPVHLDARAPATTVTADPLEFAVRQGEALPPDLPRITLATEQDARVDFTLSVTYDDSTGVHWLAVPSRVTGPATFAVGVGTSIELGRHTATLRIRAAWGTSDVQLPVTVDVTPALISTSPSSLSFVVRAATTPAELTATVTLSTGGPQVGWSASSPDVPWLAVSPASGTVAAGEPAVLAVRVVPAELASLPSGGHVATLLVSSADALGPTTVPVPVTLDVRLPAVTAVGPPVDVEGTGHDVIVIGEDLETATGVLFGDAPGTVVSAEFGRIVATPPPLAPGTYEVKVPTGIGVVAPGPAYRIVPPCVLAATAFEAPGRKARIWFDDARCELWQVDFDGGALVRRRSSEAWATDTLAIAELADAAPLPDGAHVLTWSLAGLQLVDTGSFSLDSRAPYPFSGTELGDRIVTWPDGWVTLVFDGAVGIKAMEFDPATMSASWLGDSEWMWAATAGRGATDFVALTKPPGGARGVQFWTMHWYQPYSGFALGANVDALAPDRTGRTVLALRDGSVTPGDSLLLSKGPPGTVLPGKLPATVAGALLTQDGARAIAFDGVARTVRMFDVASPPDGATGLFLELGTPGGVAPAADPGGNVVLALSGDDRILFVSGDARTVVVPLP